MLLVLLIVGAVAGTTAAVLIGLSNARKEERTRDAVSEYAVRLEAALTEEAVGQPIGSGFLILPELGTAVGELGTDDPNLRRITRDAEGWRERLTTAADEIAAITIESNRLRNATVLMSQGLRLYAGMARTIGVATSVSGRDRRELVETVTEELQVAAQIFDAGYRILAQEQVRLGIAPPAPIGG